MYLTLFTIGKLKDSFFGEAQTHYQKLLRGFCNLKIVELADEKISKNTNPEDIIAKESRTIIKALKPGQLTVALSGTGKQFSSHAWKAWLEDKKNSGEKIQFVIGGPYGLDKKLLDQADLVLSLSSFTFPHQLARIVLLEQLYRAFTIMEGKKYHY